MNNKQFEITVFSISFGICCLIAATLFMIIAKDLRDKTIQQELYIRELEWENSQNTMYCEVE